MKQKLENRIIYFSNANHCTKITQTEVTIESDKSSDHIEADTKLVALIANASIQPGKTVMVRSPSGDIDILVLFLLHQFENITVLIDNGVGKNRKIIDMSSSFLCENKRKALAGMHSFSGNDYVSSFFRKGKKVMWKLILQNEEYIETFSNLGLFPSVTEEVCESLENFVCQLYGYKNESSVDKVRFKMFQTKGIQDLFLLPPCKSNLKFHIMRANYVANMYVNAVRLNCLDDYTEHGWREDGTVEWDENYFKRYGKYIYWL